MNGLVERQPDSGSFTSGNSYSGQATLTNKNNGWNTTGVSFQLSLLKNGQVIDYIKANTTAGRYINDITLVSQPQLYLDTPTPDAGGNGTLSLSNAGGYQTILFATNRDWIAYFDSDAAGKGFLIDGSSSGSQGTSSSDLKSVTIYCPQNTSAFNWLQTVLRIETSDSSIRHYVQVNVSYHEPYASIVLTDGHNDYVTLPPLALNPADTYDINSNVYDLSVVYDPSRPSWLSAYTTNNGGAYKLNLQTVEANTGTTDLPPSGRILVTLTGTYTLHPDPSNTAVTSSITITTQQLHVKQSAPSRDIYTIYLNDDTNPVWSSDGQHTMMNFTYAASGTSQNIVYNDINIFVRRETTGGATVYGSTFTLDGEGCSLYKPSTTSPGTWTVILPDGLPYTDSRTQSPFGVKLQLDANKSFTSSKQTRVIIYEDSNLTNWL